MSISKLAALRLTDPLRFCHTVRGALLFTGSIPAAAQWLTDAGWPVTRATLFVWLRTYAEILTPEVIAALPRPKGTARGLPRADTRPGWFPTDETLERREKRHRKECP